MQRIDTKKRCKWPGTDKIYLDYHDNEWGVPVYDDRLLFEFLILEGAQAGLSWITILKRRENYIKSFDNFNAETIFNYDDTKISELLIDTGIIRNRLKIHAVIANAKAYLAIKKNYPSFADYIWKFVDGAPIKNEWKTHNQIPTSTRISEQMSKDLKHHGFKFVGGTICYAYMQAVGMVNDHVVSCYRYSDL